MLCLAVSPRHTLLCHKKRVLHLCNTPISIFSILCVFLLRCGISATPCLTRSFSKPRTLLSHSRSLGPPRDPLNLFEPLEAFEPLWTPLSLIEAIEPHWNLRSPLNPQTRSARSHFSDSPLRVLCFRVSQYTHWSHYSTTVYLVTNLAWSNPPTGAPRVIVFT